MRAWAIGLGRVLALAGLLLALAPDAWDRPFRVRKYLGHRQGLERWRPPGRECHRDQHRHGARTHGIHVGQGEYILPSLPVGPYKLTVALEGFSTYVQTGIVLQVNSNPAINRHARRRWRGRGSERRRRGDDD